MFEQNQQKFLPGKRQKNLHQIKKGEQKKAESTAMAVLCLQREILVDSYRFYIPLQVFTKTNSFWQVGISSLQRKPTSQVFLAGHCGCHPFYALPLKQVRTYYHYLHPFSFQTGNEMIICIVEVR